MCGGFRALKRYLQRLFAWEKNEHKAFNSGTLDDQSQLILRRSTVLSAFFAYVLRI